MMKCDWCGKEFPADANACVETGIEAFHPPDEGDEWKGREPVALEPEAVPPAELARLKAELEIDDSEVGELLRTGKVGGLGGLGGIVCIECQDAGLED